MGKTEKIIRRSLALTIDFILILLFEVVVMFLLVVLPAIGKRASKV